MHAPYDINSHVNDHEKRNVEGEWCLNNFFALVGIRRAAILLKVMKLE